MQNSFRNARAAALLVCAALLWGTLAGCESDAPEAGPPQAEAGTFEAEVGGALQAALQGEATARLDSTGRIVGLEFDDVADTTRDGLSFEMAAEPRAARRTYTVAPRDRGGREDTSFTLMNAYLRLRGYEFAARVGSLRVERDAAGQASGTFGLRLRGMVDAASDEAAVVTASGRFDAVPPGDRP